MHVHETVAWWNKVEQHKTMYAHTQLTSVSQEPKGHMNTQQVTGAGTQLRLHQHCSTSSAFRPLYTYVPLMH